MKRRAERKWVILLCILAAMAAAVLVRLPAARLSGVPEEYRDVFRNEEGIPYLTDPDSYYHARITDERLRDGLFRNSADEDGMLWDSQSYYPEGRSAESQPGIVWMTALLWKIPHLLSGTDPYPVEFFLPMVMAALTALAAFLPGYRLGGAAGGFVSGVMASCGAAFTGRTLPGRFDTDMFTVLMGVLLIFLFTETIRCRTAGKRCITAACFSLAVLAYSLCWSVYALVFAALTLAGGILYLLILLPRLRSDRASWREAGIGTLFCVGFSVILLTCVHGPSFIPRFIGRRSFLQMLAGTGTQQAAGSLPNVYASINELNATAFLSSNPAEWFPAYIPGKALTVVGGIGGGTVLLLCLGGMLLLIAYAAKSRTAVSGDAADDEAADKENDYPQRCPFLLYACVLGVWLAGGIYASRGGIRFVEHLSVPAGILAGVCIGNLVSDLNVEKRMRRISRILLILMICAAAVVLPLRGASDISRQNRPSVSDASADAMAWIRDHSEDPEAVTASWWDMGYYYEYASGHPVLWDGGSQNAVRAILVGKVLTSRDPDLSAAILRMLSVSGNRPAEMLIDRLGEARAFSAMWETLLLDREETFRRLTGTYGMSKAEAEEAEHMLHPSEAKEIYLIVTDLMMNQLGWIEYFGEWDFSEKVSEPVATFYSVTPDGTADMESEDEAVKAFFLERSEETIWRLYFSGDAGPRFSKEYETADGASHVQVWKVF